MTKGKRMADFILASASPRRRELMNITGLDFEVVVSDADESVVPKDLPIKLYVQELALLKASATAKQVLKNKKAHIIAADTVVTLDGKILGKPKDEADAVNMLAALSGRTHEVYTGICVMSMSDAKSVCKAVCTSVTFKELTDDKIKKYVKTKEPMDKAGAYGIQGKGSLLIDKIEGDYFNVVGLPVASLAELLENEFNITVL